MYVAEQTE